MKNLPETACKFLAAVLRGLEGTAPQERTSSPADQGTVSVAFTWRGEDYVVSLAKLAKGSDFPAKNQYMDPVGARR